MTAAKEVAMEALARGSCPRCPTNITDIICKQFINTFIVISGPANRSCLFTSSHVSYLVKHPPSSSLGGRIRGDSRLCFFVCSSSMATLSLLSMEGQTSFYNCIRSTYSLDALMSEMEILFNSTLLPIFLYICMDV